MRLPAHGQVGGALGKLASRLGTAPILFCLVADAAAAPYSIVEVATSSGVSAQNLRGIDLNNRGGIVGLRPTAQGTEYFHWNESAGLAPILPDDLPDTYSPFMHAEVIGINDEGTVFGNLLRDVTLTVNKCDNFFPDFCVVEESNGPMYDGFQWTAEAGGSGSLPTSTYPQFQLADSSNGPAYSLEVPAKLFGQRQFISAEAFDDGMFNGTLEYVDSIAEFSDGQPVLPPGGDASLYVAGYASSGLLLWDGKNSGPLLRDLSTGIVTDVGQMIAASVDGIGPQDLNATWLSEDGRVVANNSGQSPGGVMRYFLWDAAHGAVELPVRIEEVNAGGWAWTDSNSTIWRDGVAFDVNTMLDASAGITIDRIYDINRRGQVLARGNDGSNLQIVLLSPELDFRWADAVDGLWNEGENWEPGETPGAEDLAVFDLAGSYTVALDEDVNVGGTEVVAGHVTLELAEQTLTSHGLTVGGEGVPATLSISGDGGIVAATAAAALDGSGTSADAPAPGSVFSDEPIHVRGGLAGGMIEVIRDAKFVVNSTSTFDGRGLIRDLGDLTTQTLLIADGDDGRLSVQENGSVAAGELSVGESTTIGSGHRGELHIDNGLVVVAQDAVIGNGGMAEARVEGGGELRVDGTLTIGAAGTGINMLDVIGDRPDDDANEPDARIPSRVAVGDDLIVKEGSAGVRRGARMEVTNAMVAAGGVLSATFGGNLFVAGDWTLGSGGGSTAIGEVNNVLDIQEPGRPRRVIPARATIDGNLIVGKESTADMAVANGGELNVLGEVRLGQESSILSDSSGTLDVHGRASDAEGGFLSSTLAANRVHVGVEGEGLLVVRDGGTLEPASANTAELRIGAMGRATFSEGFVGSHNTGGETTSYFDVTVGRPATDGGDDTARLEIGPESIVAARRVRIGHDVGSLAGGKGTLLVDAQLTAEPDDTQLLVTEVLQIDQRGLLDVINEASVGVGDLAYIGLHQVEGFDFQNKVVIVNGGRLSGKGRIRIGGGEGSVVIPPGQNGDNHFQGAFIDPGQSPGQLTIDGNLEMSSGMLQLEIAGLEANTQHDQLIVTGDAMLSGTIVFSFLDGFAPQQGQVFEFLTVGGLADLSGAIFEIRNLAPGFEFDIAPTAEGFIMTALNDGHFVPEPAGLVLILMAWFSVGVARFRRSHGKGGETKR